MKVREIMKIKNEYIKVINSLSLPILMNYIISSVFEMLDKAIVGQYSIEGLAAVGVASSIIYAVTGSLGIFSVAYNIVAAETIGKGDYDMSKKAFYSAILTSIFIGILFIILSLVFGRSFFKLAYGLDGNILENVLDYYYPGSITVMLNMIIFIFNVYFRNNKNTKISLYSMSISTVINIFFDYSLVYGKFGFPELGVSGAAFGSVIGLSAGIIVYIIGMVVFDKINIIISFSRKCFFRMIKLYVPLLGQDIMEYTIFTMIISGIVSRLGTYSMATYTLLESIGNIVILPVFAYSTSAMTLAMQKNAADDKSAVKSILKAAIYLSLTVISFISIIFIIFPKTIMKLIVSDIEVIEKAKVIIIYLIIAQIINIFYQIYKSYLQGTDNEKFVFTTSVIVSLLSLIWIYLLAIILGVRGIYIGLALKYLGLVIIYYKKIRKCIQ